MRAPSLTLALIFAVGGGAAQAALITVNAQALPLTSDPTSIVIGGATYSFTAATASETGNGPGAAVATSGTALVASIFGSVTDFGPGATIDGTGLYSFDAFSSRAVIPNSPAIDFIGLAFTLEGGLHYGYAEVFGPNLVKLVYESSPGVGILTGASPVPEPATFVPLAIGLLGLFAVRLRKPRHRPVRFSA